ncbi:ICMT-domain-containing protein [Ascodesmis nigricans]|uniref:Protein-S-isoprenylcysteine O-methyltransferase n=1 Tax=Ascodesmis nigricans TaxID=341454 RepID=A0A4S2MKD9_9PEZI|nr:ICMT-domain-containing protein [Ascodesmis nigricans]
MSSTDDDFPPGVTASSSTHIFRRGQEPFLFPAYLYPSGSYSLRGIATRAFSLGILLASSLLTIPFTSFPQLPFFIASLSLFHFLEFWITASYNPSRAKAEAFLLTNNGSAYQIAHTTAVVEFLLEAYLVPGIKQRQWWTTYLGVGLMVVGQVARTLAMKHAGRNFSHYVKSRKDAGHVLVMDGVYAWLRHPSYFGYFWWAVGTQIMMANPVCVLGFAVVLWKFFSSRIKSEERYLCSFFPGEYQAYRKQTTVGIPFIP